MRLRGFSGIVVGLSLLSVTSSTNAVLATDQAVVKCQRAITKSSRKLLDAALQAIRGCSSSIEENCSGTECNEKVATPCARAVTKFRKAQQDAVDDTEICQMVPRDLVFAPTGLGFESLVPRCANVLLQESITTFDDIRACIIKRFQRVSSRLAQTQMPASRFAVASFVRFIRVTRGSLVPTRPFRFPVIKRDGETSAAATPTPASTARPRLPVRVTKVGFGNIGRPVPGRPTRICFAGGAFSSCRPPSTSPVPTPTATPVVSQRVRDKCAATIAEDGARFVSKGLQILEDCTDGLFGCQFAPNQARCLASARDACQGDFADLVERKIDLAAQVSDDCATIPFDGLRAIAGIDGLKCECALLGVDALATFDDYLSCYRRQHECRVVEEARFVNPRLDDLLQTVGLNTADALCPPLPVGATSRLPGRRGNFAHVTSGKFGNGTSKFPTFGPRPGPGGLPPSHRKPPTFGPPRKNGYTKGQNKTLALNFRPGRSARDAAPSALFLGLRQTDGTFVDDGVFAFELDPDQETIDVSIDYPGICSFDLVAATRDVDGVTDFVPQEQAGNVCKNEVPDGNLDDGEECDDGNTVTDDGCDPTCTLE